MDTFTPGTVVTNTHLSSIGVVATDDGRTIVKHIDLSTGAAGTTGDLDGWERAYPCTPLDHEFITHHGPITCTCLDSIVNCMCPVHGDTLSDLWRDTADLRTRLAHTLACAPKPGQVIIDVHDLNHDRVRASADAEMRTIRQRVLEATELDATWLVDADGDVWARTPTDNYQCVTTDAPRRFYSDLAAMHGPLTPHTTRPEPTLFGARITTHAPTDLRWQRNSDGTWESEQGHRRSWDELTANFGDVTYGFGGETDMDMSGIPVSPTPRWVTPNEPAIPWRPEV